MVYTFRSHFPLVGSGLRVHIKIDKKTVTLSFEHKKWTYLWMTRWMNVCEVETGEVEHKKI